MIGLPRPADFDAYWDAVDEELARYPAAPELEALPLRSTPFATTYGVRLTSLGPYRIFGYLSVPTGDGPFPGLFLVPGYASVVTPPPYDDRERYVVLSLMHRGQRHADSPFAAAYPGLLTQGIADPARYIFRGIIADLLRGAEFLLERPDLDPNRVGIMGSDWAILVAARRPRFAALQVAASFFYRLLAARTTTAVYPTEEVNDYLRTYPEQTERVAQTLAYVEPLHHAPRVTAATLLAEGDPGMVGGPEWLAPLREALGGQVERYALTHEGGTDRDWTDAWMAGRLGVEPKPRVWEPV